MSAEDNKARVRRFFEEFWNQKNLAVADDFIAATHVDHTPGSPPGLPPGPAGFKQFGSLYFTAFPDLRVIIEDQVAEGGDGSHPLDNAWHQHWKFVWHACHQQVCHHHGVTIDHIVGGKTVETWTNFDNLGMLQQLGVVPAPGQSYSRPSRPFHLRSEELGGELLPSSFRILIWREQK